MHKTDEVMFQYKYPINIRKNQWSQKSSVQRHTADARCWDTKDNLLFQCVLRALDVVASFETFGVALTRAVALLYALQEPL